jgi:hypothetical protein
VFLAGLVTFTGASLLCGVAPSQPALIGARFLLRLRPARSPRRPASSSRLPGPGAFAGLGELRNVALPSIQHDLHFSQANLTWVVNAFLVTFMALETRIQNPIMPMRILRLRGLVTASVVRGFLVTGMYSTFFLGSLYLEHVRHYSALQTGAAFLPWTITIAILS